MWIENFKRLDCSSLRCSLIIFHGMVPFIIPMLLNTNEILSNMSFNVNRSLFVPYFSYLLDGCILNLTGGKLVGDAEIVQPKKKKKKAADAEHVTGTIVSSSEWHLRYLVLSALHKCFLHDTVSFLDAPKFQVFIAYP